MASKKKGPIKVRFYRFRNRLKDKCAGLGAGDGVQISEEAMKKAELALKEMAEDYPDWVTGHIHKLSEQHSRCVDTPDIRHEFFDIMHHIAHDMKGQGGTFGYPLITDFADSLYEFTGNKADITDNHVEIVKSHIDSMRAVIKNRVSGDGGEVGTALKQELANAITKYSDEID